MKNYQIIDIKNKWKDLKSLSGNKGYYLPLVKNIKLIDIELEGLELMKQKSKEFEEFLKEKDALVKKFSLVDDKGEPIKTAEEIEGMQYFKYSIDENKKEQFDAEGVVLTEKYKDALEDMRAKQIAYMEVLDTECTIHFNKIKEADLPSEMTPELIELIYDFLELE